MIEVSVITHATEDGRRVRSQISRLLGAGPFETRTVEGHHGNPIEVSSAPAPGAAEAIGGAATPEELERAAGRRGGKVYLRLDKQRISEGRVALSESDPVRIAVGGSCRRALGLG